ncbi:Ig-like domain-containing protein [Paenibacillus sp. TRM 82003]|nr:Ig-like domain-containing protein [Paenibacillus sp. TRM 82003]
MVTAEVVTNDEVKAVTASIDGEAANLTMTEAGWVGRVTSSGGLGRKRVTDKATDESGQTGTTTLAFDVGEEPLVTVSKPEPGTVARPGIELSVSAVDDEGPPRVEVYAGEALLASGEGFIGQSLFLSKYNGQIVDLRIVATTDSGQTTETTRTVYVDASPGLKEVAVVPGSLFDVDSERILYLDGEGTLRLKNRTNGEEATVMEEANPISAYITPAGAIFVHRTHEGSYRLTEFRDGLLSELGVLKTENSLQVDGTFAIYHVGKSLMLKDLTSGVETLVSDQAGSWMNDVAEDGTVVFWTSMKYEVFRFKDGVVEKLNPDNAKVYSYPVTDGNFTLYRKSLTTYDLILRNGNEEIALASYNKTVPMPNQDYVLAGGWAAYTKPDQAGNLQVWLRSPTGVTKQLTFREGSSRIGALGENGRLLYVYEGKVYEAFFDSNAAEVFKSTAIGKRLWLDDQWHFMIGGTLFVAVEDSPLGVVVSSPAEGETGVAIGTNIEVAFSEPIEQGTGYGDIGRTGYDRSDDLSRVYADSIQ